MLRRARKGVSIGAVVLCLAVSMWERPAGAQTDDQPPIPVEGDTPTIAFAPTVTKISAGNLFTCATTDGDSFCWGNNSKKELGIGGSLFSADAWPVPLKTSQLSDVDEIAGGWTTACAITGGAAKCWGDDLYFLLNSDTPVQMPNLGSGVTAISIGTNNGCAIKSGGVICWGNNSGGRLGTGVDSVNPNPVIGLESGVTAIAVSDTSQHFCAIQSGAAKCWGIGSSGQLGNGTTTSTTAPVQVQGLTSGVTSIDVGLNNACAVHNGAVKCWGRNESGQLGTGNITNSSVPRQVVGLTSGATQVSIGRVHTCAVSGGSLSCWGFNNFGQLGTGNTTTATSPQTVTVPGGSVSSVTTGGLHTCAIAAQKPYCWGANEKGQTGQPLTVAFSTTPQEVSFSPMAPKVLGIDFVSTTSVRVKWIDAADDTGYAVYRVTGSNAVLVPCPSNVANTTSCIDSGLTPGTHYQYVVYTRQGSLTSPPSSYMLTYLPLDLPKQPLLTSAVAFAEDSVRLKWTDQSTNESGFAVYQYSSGTYELETIVTANSTTATISKPGLTASPRIFVVTAYNISGETYSDTYTFTTSRQTVAPGPVAPPELIGATATDTTATVTWEDQASNEAGYLVYRVEGSNQTQVGCPISTPNLASCTDTGLTPGKYYQYFVYAWNNSGVGSPATSIVVHTPKPLPSPRMTAAAGVSSNGISLFWEDNASDETGYRIFEYVGGSLTAVADVPADSRSFKVTSLAAGSTHIYVVAVLRGTDIRYANTALWATTSTT